jgi:hypothetical protein
MLATLDAHRDELLALGEEERDVFGRRDEQERIAPLAVVHDDEDIDHVHRHP